MLESQLEAIMARRRLSHGSTQSSGSTAEPGESEMSSFRRIWSIAGSLVLVALIVLGLYNLLRWIFPKSFTPTPQQIIFAGRITNQGTGEWPNDRLVLLFVKGKEVGRSITKLGEFVGSGQGIHDGLFVVTIPNTYGLRTDSFKISKKTGLDFNQPSRLLFFRAPYMYHWFEGVPDDGVLHMPVPSKNLEYIVKVLPSDVKSLPQPLLVAGVTELKSDNSIVVALANATTPQGDSKPGSSSGEERASVRKVNYAPGVENVEINKLTIPINSCGGSSKLTQEFSQSQTFIHEYRGEIGGNVGGSLPLPFKFINLQVELQAKYGFEQGQIDSRTVSYRMEAEPGRNLVYAITWKEVWESGIADMVVGKDTINIPFRIKTNLIYEVNSTQLSCVK